MNQNHGSRQRLDSVISAKEYFAIGFGVVIGVGWVVYAGQWLIAGGALGAVLAFMIGGVLLIPIGKCYAELTAALPLAGGELAFTYKAFGPLAAFLTAWALSLSYVFVTPFETIAIGAMFEAIVPALTSKSLYSLGGYDVALSNMIPGIVVAAWVIAVNWRGTRGMVRTQFLMTMALLCCTAAFVCLALLKGDPGNLKPLFRGEGPLLAVVPASIASVLAVVPFFLAGFNTIAQAAEESGLKVQPRQLGVAIVTTIAIGTAFYVLIILALGFSVPPTELAAIVAQRDILPMAHVFRVSLGYEWAAQLVLLAALLGIVSTLNGIFMAATRLLYAQSRGGLLPEWFAELHSVHHTPVNAIKFVGTIALIGPFVGKVWLIVIVNCGSLVFAGVLLMTTLATLRLRHSRPDLARPYRNASSTVWLAIVMSILLVGLMTAPGSPGQMGTTEFLTVGVWMVAGTVFYFLRQRTALMTREKQVYQILGQYR